MRHLMSVLAEPRSSRQISRRWRQRLICLTACCAASLPLDSSRPGAVAVGAKAPSKAWFDARTVCVFPLRSRQMPRNVAELGNALTSAYRAALEIPEANGVVRIRSAQYPAIQSLSIDLSDAVIHPSPKADKDKNRPNNKPVGKVGVDRFEFRGEPLLCDRAKLNLSLSAADARLFYEHDKHGKPILMLADAREGQLDFAATQSDLERILLDTTREAASPYGLTIEKTRIRIEAASPHSVTATVHVATRFALVPAGMTFKAHVEIDDAMNARLSGLTISGDDVLGPLIVGFLRPGLKKYEGTSRPLVSFPSPAMKLRDVSVMVDDQIHLHAAFGR